MAIISKVRIANLAISMVHAKGIESLTDAAQTEAVVANLWYDQARRETLEAFNWGFARTREALAIHAVAEPESEWVYRYVYPAACLMARYIENPVGVDEDAVAFQVENAGDGTQSIVTDEEDAVLVYTRDEEATSLFTPLFISAHASKLAYYMAGTLTNKQKMQQTLLAQHDLWIGRAAASDANQGVERKPRDADSIRGR